MDRNCITQLCNIQFCLKKLHLEILRCNPQNITANNVTSNSVLISWLVLRLSTNILHKNYSVTITSNVDQNIQYSNTTEQEYLFIPNLSPYHRYTCIVKAIGLDECFEEELKLYFQTRQAGE